MHRFKRVLLVLIALLVVGGVVIFMLENQQLVALSFLGWSTPSISVSLCVVLAFLLGLIVAPLILSIVFRRGVSKVNLFSRL